MRKILIAAVIVVVLGAFPGWRYGLPAYRHFKEKRSLRMAQSFMQKADYENAFLSLRQVLALNSTNLEACQIMADLADASHSPAAVVWRSKVAELAPTTENRLILASCALRHEAPPFPVATKTLESVREAAGGQTAFHVVSAERAIRLNLTSEAEQHLEEAMRLEPTNQLHALNLSVLRLQSADPKLAGEARTKLEALGNDSQYGLVALRSLAADSLNRKDWPAAIQLSNRVLANTNGAFSDRIQHLTILQAAEIGGRKSEVSSPGEKAGFETYLKSLKEVAATNLGNIADLGSWLNGHDRAGEAVAWLKSLPAGMQSQQPVPLILADGYMIQQDWRTLQTWLRDQKWEEQDFIRLAMLTRAWRSEEGGVALAKNNWSKAVRAASERPDTLAALANMAQGWGWTNEVREVLWETAKQFPSEQWASQALEKSLYLNGNTRDLLKLYSAMLERNPKDPLAMNNVATVSMLLKTNLDQAHGLARNIYAQNQTNAAIASTYAFSLYLQGKTNEALGIMVKLTQEDLHRGGVAAYYAVLLNAVGETEKAKTYRALAERGLLLPEERELLN